VLKGLTNELRSKASGFFHRLYDNYPKISYFLVLARLDKPIGIYLLLWPTLWGLWFAAEGKPGWHLFLVFTLGTIITRSAGCIINDIADVDFDREVKRTVNRPLAQNKLSLKEAYTFLGILLVCALLLVLTTNLLTLMLAVIACFIAGIYPLMKRYTYLPQVVLGIAFSFGIPMAFAATNNEVPNLAWLLFTANVVWTVSYDTAYAMVDRDDDIKLGLKSTAILFAELDTMMIATLQIMFLGFMAMAYHLTDLGWPYFLGLGTAAALFVYQQYLLKDRIREKCFEVFLNNHWVGLVIFLGVIVQFGI
jgi:4-hydroxybenzoate polyprenyltransferase